MHRLWVPQLREGQRVFLTGADERKVRRVLRLGAGDRIVLFDGQMHEAEAEIVDCAGGRAALAVGPVRRVDRESPLRIRLIQALAKGERMDWVIQKATELGASEICVLRAHRSIPRVEGAPSRTRMERWNRIAVEAARQCGRTRVPILSGPVTLETLCRRVAREAGLKLVAWEGETKRGLRGAVAEAGQGCQEAWLAVGPEGGFEEVEVRALEGAGFRPVRLGPRILRTESAGPAAMAILQHLLGDLE